jgi:hypothetical protein
MNKSTSALLKRATKLRAMQPTRPPLETLDEVMCDVSGRDLDFEAPEGDQLAPDSDFGELVRLAFPHAEDQQGAVRAFERRYRVRFAPIYTAARARTPQSTGF